MKLTPLNRGEFFFLTAGMTIVRLLLHFTTTDNLALDIYDEIVNICWFVLWLNAAKNLWTNRKDNIYYSILGAMFHLGCFLTLVFANLYTILRIFQTIQ